MDSLYPPTHAPFIAPSDAADGIAAPRPPEESSVTVPIAPLLKQAHTRLRSPRSFRKISRRTRSSERSSRPTPATRPCTPAAAPHRQAGTRGGSPPPTRSESAAASEGPLNRHVGREWGRLSRHNLHSYIVYTQCGIVADYIVRRLNQKRHHRNHVSIR